MLPYHRCTDEDYSKFLPIEKQYKELLFRLKTDPKRGLFCIDDSAFSSINLQGNWRNENHERLEILVLPCNHKVTPLVGGTDEYISENCVADLEDQIKYLGPINMFVYHNTASFIAN